MNELQGGFIWYELLTPSTSDSAGFYPTVVGWTVDDMRIADVIYQIFKAGDRSIAAIIDTSADAAVIDAPVGWIGYVGVDNVDAIIDRMVGLGATVRQAPVDVAEIGRFAIVADPQGADIGLFSPDPGNTGSSPSTESGVGHVGWHELYTDDPERALAFYADVFGWRQDHVFDMGPAGAYHVFSAGGRAVGGIMRKPDVVSRHLWCPFFRVSDITGTEAHVMSEAGRILDGLREVPGGDWTVKCADSHGTVFALTGRKG